MVNNFIFIEDGSLDAENLNKLMKNSENSNIKFITYKQGAAKPELVSIENNEPVKNMDTIRKEIVDVHRAVVLDALEKFINEKTDRYVESDPDLYTLEVVRHKFIYRGTPENFVDQFEEFLKNYKG